MLTLHAHYGHKFFIGDDEKSKKYVRQIWTKAISGLSAAHVKAGLNAIMATDIRYTDNPPTPQAFRGVCQAKVPKFSGNETLLIESPQHPPEDWTAENDPHYQERKSNKQKLMNGFLDKVRQAAKESGKPDVDCVESVLEKYPFPFKQALKTYMKMGDLKLEVQCA